MLYLIVTSIAVPVPAHHEPAIASRGDATERAGSYAKPTCVFAVQPPAAPEFVSMGKKPAQTAAITSRGTGAQWHHREIRRGGNRIASHMENAISKTLGIRLVRKDTEHFG